MARRSEGAMFVVPTDPFVPSDPNARPRQQQNLPPGIALPPPGDWRSDRPGDLGPEQPEGRLFGRPGPNVGYAYTLVQRVKDRLRLGPYEHVQDALAVVAEVAGKRAALYGRAPVIGDIEHAIAILGYDGTAGEAFVAARTAAVHDASHSYYRRRAVVDSVPDSLLRQRPQDAASDIAAWRAALPAAVASD